MTRVIAAYITEADAEWLQISLKSILYWIDHVYIIYSHKEGDKTLELINSLNDERITIIASQYDHQNKGADGKQRNKYLNILKKIEKNNWCLVLDSDEVVDDDAYKLKAHLEKAEHEAYDVKMRHMVLGLRYEDATLPEHYVPRRLFKVTENLVYEEVEHPLLKGFNGKHGMCNFFTIWHFSYVKNIFTLLKKYNKNLEKSNIHTKDFLDWWYKSLLFLDYPVKEVTDHQNFPKIIKEAFHVE